MSSVDVPDDVKFVGPYLQRSLELKAIDPIVSYYCAYYAAKLAVQAGSKNKDSQVFLINLLDSLERDKKDMAGNEALTNDTVGYAHVESFALKIFKKADDEDRAGRASKKTAKTFLAASLFFDVLKVFGEIDEDVTEKIKYSKFKAADITKALKEGRQPTPGPPGGDPADQPTAPADASSSSDPFGFGGGPPAVVTSPAASFPAALTGSVPINPTPAFQPRSDAAPFDSAPLSSITPPSAPSPPSLSGLNLHSNDAVGHGSPFAHGGFPAAPAPQSFSYTPSAPPPASVFPSIPSGNPLGHTPSPLPSAYPVASAPQPVAAVASPARHSSLSSAFEVDYKAISNAQKLSKYAISALQYEDINTAIENLEKALAILRPMRK
ncbi:Vta1 like-domain-containing protein [Polychytrium aggregatum]|uniref:Vta1 like-domain-containing protein n=1 Tax=Polychytrium aggregatum TaxID=110093 RepID=UPI0022FE25B1|nr:Vta1 like-domain-containing protein [Polychytrium aggregatum]KAI9204570.1 Vta1 like-domain-containing protein [Polychytrium aggregatum]